MVHMTGIKNFINISSSCIYPRNFKKKLREELIFKGNFEPTNEGYAVSKFLSMEMCKFVSEKKGFNYKTLIPCNLYGPNDDYDPEKSHLLAAIIKKLNDAKKKKNPNIEIWGNGKARRIYVCFRFISSNIIFNKKFDKIPNILNIGTGVDYTVEQHYKIASKIIYPSAKFYFNKKTFWYAKKIIGCEQSKKLDGMQKLT